MDLGDYVAYVIFKFDESGVKKAKQGLKEVDKEASELEKILGKVFKAFTAGHAVVSTMNYIKKGFLEATAEARKFEFALLDIKKVHPEVDLSTARQDIINLGKVAPGKSLTDDLAPAYKRAIQVLGDQSRMAGFMSLVEKQSVAYDMSAEETAKYLGILDANFNKNNKNLTGEQKNNFLANLGNKMAYGHHNYGNALVPDIMFALQKASGIVSTSKSSPDFALSVITNLLNTGTRAEASGLFFRRLYSRIVKGVDLETGKRITGMSAAFEKLGLDKQTMQNTLRVNGDNAFLTLFSAMAKRQRSHGDLAAIAVPFAGQYVIEDMLKIVRDFDNVMKLYNVFTGKIKDASGKLLTENYVENAYNTIMRSTEKLKQASETSKEIAQINIGEEFLPLIRGFYELKKSFYEGLGENFKAPTKEEMDSLIEFANIAGKVLSAIAAIFIKIPTKLLQSYNIHTDEDAMKSFVLNNVKDGQEFSEKWTTRINDFFGITQPQEAKAMTSFYQPPRDFNDFIGRIQNNNNSTINSGGNKNINVNINQNNEFNGANSENMTQITNEILSAIETQIKQS